MTCSGFTGGKEKGHDTRINVNFRKSKAENWFRAILTNVRRTVCTRVCTLREMYGRKKSGVFQMHLEIRAND